MSDEQDLGRDMSTTQGPPPSYGRRGNSSIIASSQLSPRSPAPSRRDSRIERDSWGEPGTERIDPKRRSAVTFGGKTSVAPSDSISKVQSRPTRASTGFSAPGTQNSYRSRQRSAPWQDHDYRSTFPSKAGSSRGGAAWSGGAPLTETNLEEFNERRPPRSEAVQQRDVERDVAFEELDRKSGRQSRRDSAVVTQSPPKTRAGWIGADYERRTSRATSRVERDDGYGDRTLVTTRRRTEVEEDWPRDEVVTRPKLKSRYPSYSQPTQSSQSKVSTKRQSRAAGVYEQASARQSSFSSGRQTRHQTLAGTRRSRPPTMPPEDDYSTQSPRAVGSVAAGAAARAAVATNVGSHPDSRSKTSTQFFEEVNETQSRRTEPRSEQYSSRQTQAQTCQTEVDKSERYSQREAETEQPTTTQQTQPSGTVARRSQAPSRPAELERTTAARPATPPYSSPSRPTSANSPAAPSAPDDTQWERRLHIITSRGPDGRLIRDQEYSMRRIWPQQPVGA